jgi:hypothetical protein
MNGNGFMIGLDLQVTMSLFFSSRIIMRVDLTRVKLK